MLCEKMCVESQPGWTPGEAQLTLATAQVRSLCQVTGCQAWKSPRYPLMTWGINPQERLGPQQPPRSGTFPCSLSRFAAKETGPSEAALSSQPPDSHPQHPPCSPEGSRRVSPEEGQPDPCNHYATEATNPGGPQTPPQKVQDSAKQPGKDLDIPQSLGADCPPELAGRGPSLEPCQEMVLDLASLPLLPLCPLCITIPLPGALAASTTPITPRALGWPRESGAHVSG